MTLEVRRLTAEASEIAIGGEVTSAAEGRLIDAYHRASAEGARVIVLDFGRLEYMNSGGIGLLVTLLIRAQRQGQRLMAVGLNEHYRQILALTRLDESIGIHATEAEALASAGA
ncbi:MAG: STAS domain-containing protein [Candidatus Limnocylindrales bacterium]